MVKIELTDEQFLMLLNLATKVDDGESEWYYLPFWFRRIPKQAGFEIYNFDQLPESLKESIDSIRNIIKDPQK